MKKIFRIFLFGLLLFTLFPIITQAAFVKGTAYFGLSSPSTFYVGDEFSVALYVQNVYGYDEEDYLTYLNSRLTYDATKVEYVSGTTDMSGSVSLSSEGIVNVQTSTSETTFNAGERLAVIRFRGLAETTSTQISFSALTAKAGSNETALITNTYNFTFAILPEESTNNDLESLTVKDNSNKVLTLTPKFNSEVLNYELNVPYSTTYLKLTPILDDTKATYKVTGSLVLVAEENNYITITVTAESGAVKVYEIIAYREEEISEDASLKSLTVNGYPNFTFDPTRTTYTLVYTSQDDLDEFDLEYEKTDEEATVEVDQPNTLEDGSQVKIIVTAEDEETSTTYTLRIRLNSTTTTTTSKSVATSSNNTIGIILVIAIVVIAITIGVLLFILKKGPKSKNKPKPKEDTEETKIFNNEEPESKEEDQDLDEQIDEEKIDEEEMPKEDEDEEPTRIFD